MATIAQGHATSPGRSQPKATLNNFPSVVHMSPHNAHIASDLKNIDIQSLSECAFKVIDIRSASECAFKVIDIRSESECAFKVIDIRSESECAFKVIDIRSESECR